MVVGVLAGCYPALFTCKVRADMVCLAIPGMTDCHAGRAAMSDNICYIVQFLLLFIVACSVCVVLAALRVRFDS